MRIYILGGSGMLGTAFIKHFKHHTVVAPTSAEIDILDYAKLERSVTAFKPDVVINLVALCDMEACEKYPTQALQLHALGSAHAALVSAQADATYVYLSSACVFDGNEVAYASNDPTNPISVYGKTKLMGEQIARSFPKHIVLRTEWCFGGVEHDAKFIGKLYRQIKAGAKKVSAVNDKYGSLSYLPDLAVALERLIEQKSFGTFHVSCSGFANRYEVASAFVSLLGDPVTVESVDSSYFEHFAIYTAPRPKREVLLNSVIPGFTPRHWRRALAEYAKEF